VAAAGGELLMAGFTLLGQILGTQSDVEPRPAVAKKIKDRLSECIDRDENGRLRLSITLPDDTVLDRMSEILSGLIK
jgi:hypothetical protein